MSEDTDACKLCGKPFRLHGFNSDCGMFLSSKPGAREAERAAVVKWLRSPAAGPRDERMKLAHLALADAIESGAHLNEGDK